MKKENPVFDEERLESLRSTGLLDHGEDAEFDRITAIAARMLDVPVCLVSLVDENRQVFTGVCGLPAPYDELRETPLSHSFCQHAVRECRPLVICDARKDPRVANNGAVDALNVIAYLGFPLIGPDRHIHGAFCVIDGKPRDWTESEIELVQDFTSLVAGQIELFAERARERNSLDLVIHDLKSPLAGIQMAAGMLKDRQDDLPEPIRPLVDAMGESSAHALNLVESVAKRDRKLADTGCDAGVVMRGVVDRHTGLAGEKELALSFDVGGDHLVTSAEAWVVEHVAENLLTNAIKFTPAGGAVRVVVAEEAEGVMLEVADDGPGFTKEDLPKLFRRYARMSARPTAGETSTGLGLSIVKHLAEEAGGSVALVSEPGEGAVMRVLFPLGSS